jgi:hypothetical protein
MANVVIFSETFKAFLREKSETSKVCNSLYLYSQNYKLKSYELMINPNEVNYITFRNNGLISYLPKGKEHLENESGTWKKENRQEGKPAKVIRKLFTDKAVKLFKEADLDCFNNLYKTYFNTELIFEMLNSSEISNVYAMQRKEGGGSLNSSCMHYKSYFDIYENCKSLKILILKNKEGLLCGRALIWFVDGVYIMDRIYTTDDYIFEMFFDYANKHDFIRKSVQSYSDKTTWINSDGMKFEKYFKIYTDTDFSEYPYIDTFSYGNDGFLSNENSFDYTYNNTDGTRDGDNNNYDEDEHDGEVWDEISEEWINEDDAVTIEYGRYRNHTTHYENTITTVCDRIYWNGSDEIVTLSNGDVVEMDDAVFCEYTNEYYHYDDCTLVEKGNWSDNYINTDYVITDINGETWCKYDNDITEINYEYYPIDSELITEIDGKYFLIEELGNAA